MSDVEIGFDADAVQAALAATAEALRAELEARIKAKVSGDVLHVRSGALIDSISTDVEVTGDDVAITAASTGVPYAAILERGGKTAAHDIVAMKTKALAFVAGGAQHFAKKVHHPGSRIKAYAYLLATLDEMSPEMERNLKDAVLAALGTP